MGPNVEMGVVQEAIHLNRLMRLFPPGAEGGEKWEIEADPRHVEILVSQVGLRNESKAVSTPGFWMTDEEDGKELDAEVELTTDRGRCGSAISVKTGVSCSSR